MRLNLTFVSPFILLYRHITLQILCFLQIGLWQRCVRQVYQCHFSNTTCFMTVCLILGRIKISRIAVFQTFPLLLYLFW